jgi:hypothetical protein
MAPAAERLRAAIGAVMARATAPEICKTATTLAAKWEKLRRSPVEAALKPPQLNWPAQQRQQEPQGKINIGNKFFFHSINSKEKISYQKQRRRSERGGRE